MTKLAQAHRQGLQHAVTVGTLAETDVAAARPSATDMDEMTTRLGKMSTSVERAMREVRAVREIVEEVNRRPVEQEREMESLFALMDDLRGRQLKSEMEMMKISASQAELLAEVKLLRGTKRHRTPSPDSPNKNAKVD